MPTTSRRRPSADDQLDELRDQRVTGARAELRLDRRHLVQGEVRQRAGLAAAGDALGLVLERGGRSRLDHARRWLGSSVSSGSRHRARRSSRSSSRARSSIGVGGRGDDVVGARLRTRPAPSPRAPPSAVTTTGDGLTALAGRAAASSTARPSAPSRSAATHDEVRHRLLDEGQRLARRRRPPVTIRPSPREQPLDAPPRRRVGVDDEDAVAAPVEDVRSLGAIAGRASVNARGGGLHAPVDRRLPPPEPCSAEVVALQAATSAAGRPSCAAGRCATRSRRGPRRSPAGSGSRSSRARSRASRARAAPRSRRPGGP